MKRLTFFLFALLALALALRGAPHAAARGPAGGVTDGNAVAYDNALTLQALDGSGPTINVPVVHITSAPEMDGECEPEEYEDANKVSYQYLPNFDDHVVHILRTPHHLYFCFQLLGLIGYPEPGTEEDARVAVYLDRLNDGQLGSDDLIIRQPYLGEADAAVWDAQQGSFSGGDPGGWQVANNSSPGIPGQEFSRHWSSAEFRVSRQMLGGWQRTIGFAVMHHHIPCPDCAIEYSGWPNDDVFDDAQGWGNAALPTGEITIGPAEIIPTVDGRCDLAQEWGDAAFTQFPSGSGLASVRVKHSDTDLYVCMMLFKPAVAVRDGPNAAVMINRTGQGGERPGADDMRFTISYNGTVRANRGDGSGWDGPDPGGYTIARQNVAIPNANLWLAEFRISGATLGGGWDRDINIGFAQQWLNGVGDDYGWPENSWWWNIPNNWGVGHLTSNPVPEARDIRPTGMEVVQTVQDLDNSVLLVAKKRTFVRVHVDTDSSVTGVTARLHGYRDGAPLGFPLQPLNTGADVTVLSGQANRGSLEDSFYFELPRSWISAGVISLRAEINPFHEIAERNYRNNEIVRPIVPFEETNPLHVRLVDYGYVLNNDVISVSRFDMDMVASQLRRMYPISRLFVDKKFVVDLSIDSMPSADYVNSHLRYLREVWERREGQSPDTIYYGMVSDAGGFMRGKAGGIPARYAAGPAGEPGVGGNPNNADNWDFDGTYADWYAAHEIGHTLGRKHAEFCGAGGGADYPYPAGMIGGPAGEPDRFYGFDVGDSALGLPVTVVPNTWTDSMSYCAGQWISDFTYEGIHRYIQQQFGAVAPSSVAPAAPVEGDYLAVYGSVNTVQQTASIPFLSRQALVMHLPERTPGPYHIRLYDEAGALLADYPFTPGGGVGDDDEEVDQIAQIVAWAPGTQRVAISSDVAGRELFSTTVSENAPEVAITTRSGGDALPASGPLTLQWEATDADGDALQHIVLYSFDNRASWRTLATAGISNTLTLDAAQLEGTGGEATGWLRVVARDGVLTSYADTGPFQVADKAPTVHIASPEPESVSGYGQLVTLEGYGEDFEDGTLQDAQLRWHSSLDGDLGEGHLLHATLLSVGEHTITLAALDGAGNEASASITIHVTGTVEEDGPTLAAAPSTLLFQAEAGSAAPPALRLSVRNTGSGSLAWTASAGAPWLALDVSEGAAPGEILVSVDTTSFRRGEVYGATITVQGAGQLVEVPVIVQMLGAPADGAMLYLPFIANRP